MSEHRKYNLLVVQGANMARLGKRNPLNYGHTSAAELNEMMLKHAQERGFNLDIFYTHIEGEAIAKLYDAEDAGCDGLVMNPAGFLYAGYALRDCLREVKFPYIEIHVRNSAGLGTKSITAEASSGYMCGFGIDTYFHALDAMVHLLDKRRAAQPA